MLEHTLAELAPQLNSHQEINLAMLQHYVHHTIDVSQDEDEDADGDEDDDWRR